MTLGSFFTTARRASRPWLLSLSALPWWAAGACTGLTGCGGSDPAAPSSRPEEPSREKERDPESPATETVPEFGGIQDAVVENHVDVRLRWETGRDAQTPPEKLVYLVYLGESDGDMDLPVSIGRPYATSLPGETSIWLRDLPTGRYRFVVRVVDEHGHIDQNRASVTVSVGDRDPPSFFGVRGAQPITSRQVLVDWNPAEDEITPQELLKYEVYLSASRDDLFDSQPHLPLQGATSHLLELGDPLLRDAGDPKVVFIGVRARDEAGNLDENERRTSLTTPENTPPHFAGVKSVVPHPLGIELSWDRASDNVTPSAELVYRVYVAAQSGRHNFLEPYAISAPGVPRLVVTDLLPETQYYFVVQAEDAAGNRDFNQVEKSFVTRQADASPPTFGGVDAIRDITPTSATLSFGTGIDDRTPSEQLVYEAYLSNKSGNHHFSAAPDAVSLPGRSSLVLLGLKPATKYFVTVRARDSAGLQDDNETVLEFDTPSAHRDSEPPRLTGNVTVQAVPSQPTWLQIGWSGAQDDAGPVRGHVCIAEDPASCEDEAFFSALNATSGFGNASVFVDNLQPRTEYWAFLRLEDGNGNLMPIPASKRGKTATSFASNVVPILESRCNQCHEFNYGSVINVPSGYQDLPLVAPGNPLKSYLLRTLREPDSTESPFTSEVPASHNTVRMPSDGTSALSSALEGALFDWVAEGAFDN